MKGNKKSQEDPPYVSPRELVDSVVVRPLKCGPNRQPGRNEMTLPGRREKWDCSVSTRYLRKEVEAYEASRLI
jgi:hypothetical protein